MHCNIVRFLPSARSHRHRGSLIIVTFLAAPDLLPQLFDPGTGLLRLRRLLLRLAVWRADKTNINIWRVFSGL